jgi:hypothetical protein
MRVKSDLEGLCIRVQHRVRGYENTEFTSSQTLRDCVHRIEFEDITIHLGPESTSSRAVAAGRVRNMSTTQGLWIMSRLLSLHSLKVDS